MGRSLKVLVPDHTRTTAVLKLDSCLRVGNDIRGFVIQRIGEHLDLLSMRLGMFRENLTTRKLDVVRIPIQAFKDARHE